MLKAPVIVEESDLVYAICKATGISVDDWYKDATDQIEVSDSVYVMNHKNGSLLCESLGDGKNDVLMRVSPIFQGHPVRA